DIKPSNLMLTPAGQVKLLDLGLARLVNEPANGSRITAHGQFLGTADYVSPEQCYNSRAVDIRSDIYSLGCTLYHLLPGEPPSSPRAPPPPPQQKDEGPRGTSRAPHPQTAPRRQRPSGGRGAPHVGEGAGRALRQPRRSRRRARAVHGRLRPGQAPGLRG